MSPPKPILLSDAALALAIDCEIKWLYNSARWLDRPIGRAIVDATWWRLVHHFAVGLAVPLADAARAADTLLASGMHPGRIQFRATKDESVSIVVDLARFHDGAALALAAAQFLAEPRMRGRPRTRVAVAVPSSFTADEMAAILRLRALSPGERLEEALDGLPTIASENRGARRLTQVLIDAVIPFVITGDVAAMIHGAPWQPSTLDVCADLSTRYCPVIGTLLNELGALPRGTPVRDGFHFDVALLRAPTMLALRIGSLSVNIRRSIPGIGEYQQVESKSIAVDIESWRARVLGLDSLLEAMSIERRVVDGLGSRRLAQLRILHSMEPRTR